MIQIRLWSTFSSMYELTVFLMTKEQKQNIYNFSAHSFVTWFLKWLNGRKWSLTPN